MRLSLIPQFKAGLAPDRAGQKGDVAMSQRLTEEWPSDETLVQFADGQLDAAETDKVARFLEGNDEARRFVERLVESGDIAKIAFDRALERHEPDPVLELLLTGARASETSDRAKVLPFSRRSTASIPASRLALPMAAAIALIVGGVGGYEMGRQEQPSNGLGQSALEIALGPVSADTALASLLNTKPSGDPLTVNHSASGQEREIMVLASFRDGQSRYCREFEVLPVSEGAAPLIFAVACRAADSRWHIQAATSTAPPQSGQTEDIRPAAGEQPAAMDAILKSLGVSTALTADEEAGLIEQGWMK